jgi:galactokinase
MKDIVHKRFRELFHKEPAIIIAPGRINLIGEHTDYNDGFVMPAAIDKHIVFAIASNGTDQVNCTALDYKESASFRLDELKPGSGWVNYLMGVMDGLHKVGFKAGGVDCVFGSTIPTGAGLSSSAALCCGFGFGVGDIFDLQLSRLGIAKIAQYAEHQFAGVMCGIMDQYASLFGEPDCALLLDCQALAHETVPVRSGDYSILLIDTKVKHSLASTAYNDRRESCEKAVAIISRKHAGVKSLRDVTMVMLNESQDHLGEDTYIKARFVVDEIARTRAAADKLRASQIEAFGALMFETHWGLSKSYDVSCTELDHLVLLAEENRHLVCGARMMGGGFGGCTINFVKSGSLDYVKGYVHDKYFTTFGIEPDFYTVQLSQGVHKSGT